MARDETRPQAPVPECLRKPAISLVGSIDQPMVEKLVGALRDADDGDVAVEMTTLGGGADLARRMALEVEQARERRSGRLLFLGKTAVYSAGTTVMAAFPREDRFLTADAVLMIHCRQLDEKIALSGPIRSSLPKLEAAKRQIEVGIALEERGFRKLIEGSDIGLDELFEKALHDWYLTAEEAVKRRLIAGIV